MPFILKPKEKEVPALKLKLTCWKELERHIKNMSERELKKAMHVEFETNGRIFIINRLKSRYNVLRNKREKLLIDRKTWK